MPDPKWEWMDSIFGMVLGVISTVGAMLGWINPKLTRIDERHGKLREDLERKVDEVHERVTPLAQEVAALKAHREGDHELLVGINDTVQEIQGYLRSKRNGGSHGG